MFSHVQLDDAGDFLRLIPAGQVIEWDANNYCSAFALEKDGKAEQFRVLPFFTVGRPAHDPITQAVREVDPAPIDGQWTQRWEIVQLSPEQVKENMEAKKAADAALVASKIEALWSAADRYVAGYISGVAIGVLTLGVMQMKPKCMAVSEWSYMIWADYYRRKALVTVDSVDDLDFSAFGPMPYSVPELQAEVGI